MQPSEDAMYPRLVDGAGAAPPEDFGGIWRWNDFVAEHQAGEDLGEHWSDIDPADFDPTPRALARARRIQRAPSTLGEMSSMVAQMMDDVVEQGGDSASEDRLALLAKVTAKTGAVLDELEWALNELFVSEDGLSPRVREIYARHLADDRLDAEQRLLDVVEKEALRDAPLRAPGYAAYLLAENGGVSPSLFHRSETKEPSRPMLPLSRCGHR